MRDRYRHAQATGRSPAAWKSGDRIDRDEVVVPAVRRSLRAKITDDDLQRAAAAYRAGGIPAVKTALHVADRQAWRYVQRCPGGRATRAPAQPALMTKGLNMASIDKRPNGSYRARWREYPGAPQRTRTFARKVDAQQHLVKVQHDLLSGTYIDPSKAATTVGAFYRSWSARQPWREKTRSAYGSSFNHVLARFEDWPLSVVTTGEVEAWAAGLPLAASSAGLAVTHLSAMFEAAVRDGYRPRNPCWGAKRPEVIAEPVVPFSIEQLDQLAAGEPDWFRVALTLGAGLGLRQAEACGLSNDRVDWLRREVKVDRQLVTSRAHYGQTSFGPLKTRRSYRTVPLSQVAAFELAAHVERFGTGRDELLLHDRGAPVHATRFRDLWQQSRRRAGLPARDSTTPAIRSPRCCCRAGCRWRRWRSTWGTRRRRC